MSETKAFKTWVEISQSAIEHNLKQFRQLVGDKVKLMSVVKSNAYGHGLTTFAAAAEPFADWFGVDSVDEAIQLRSAGITKPILVLGYTLNDRLADIIQYDLRPTVYNLETIQRLGQLAKDQNKTVQLHIKVETGTSRQGVLGKELASFVKEIKKHSGLEIEGLSTHFANIEDTTSHLYAQQQLDAFQKAVETLKKEGIDAPIKHTACSAAAILFPETHFNLARVGIGQYGLWPSRETFVSAAEKKRAIELRPVLTWKTRTAQVKKISAGTYVSYGCTERVTRDSTISVLPIGYFDGFDRKLSSVGTVLINGRLAKVLGRVCMNMVVVDITDIPRVKNEDEVVIIGRQEKEIISAESMATKVGTINYELVTRINPLIPRVLVK